MGQNETRWSRLVARVGEHDFKINAALLSAMTAFQDRYGCLPGGYDYAEWEDVYRGRAPCPTWWW